MIVLYGVMLAVENLRGIRRNLLCLLPMLLPLLLMEAWPFLLPDIPFTEGCRLIPFGAALSVTLVVRHIWKHW